MCLGVHRWPGVARRVPAPISTMSAHARSKPMTKRSAGSWPLITEPDDGYSGPRWLVLIGGLARLTLALRGLVCHQDRRGSLRALPPAPVRGPGQAAGEGYEQASEAGLAGPSW